MGEFISMSGVKGSTRTDVVRSLRQFASSKGGLMEPASPQAEPFGHLLISGDENGPVTVVYPYNFSGCDKSSSFLSASLGAPVLSLHIHDGDFWMYVLFVDGEVVDRFNPIPDYWSDLISLEQRSEWKGDAEVLARTWQGLDASSIEKYLVPWDLDLENAGEAYVDDIYPYGDCWQLTDFMKKLGLVYPIDDEGEIQADWYRFEVKKVR